MNRSSRPCSFHFLVAALVVLTSVLLTASAWAFTPPPMTGHVTDPGARLTKAEHDALGAKLAAYRTCSTHEVAILLAASLDGANIEDAAYATFNAWKLGHGSRDNGVLLVVAPVERKVRIEVGKGLDGALPDLRANDILREHVSPHMKRDEVFAALDEGTTEIGKVLGGCAIAPASVASAAPPAPPPPASKPAAPVSAPSSPGKLVDPPLFESPNVRARVLMALGIALLVALAVWGARGEPVGGAIVTVAVTGMFTGWTSFVDGRNVAQVLDNQLGWFVAACVVLVIVNIVAWGSRRYGNTAGSESSGGSSGSAGSSYASSSPADPWPSSSSAGTSFGSSSSSSDNGSGFTGGGGSSGGAGSSDSY